ncbi:hypothetical protein DPMN_034070 [Dreissena polymorpha]|uniref:Peptidase A2 domain-containing protein n=1 Tax=Dreissena polymorpha TaxID=45954 RepID=A0A9D4M7W9_DREPO|nr:hypothetical protein DPMN_034070 [Dreissena polymorpha]
METPSSTIQMNEIEHVHESEFLKTTQTSDAACVTPLKQERPSEISEGSIRIVTGGSSAVKIIVGNIPVLAKIDSGAEITIISTNVYDKLERKPSKVKDVQMQVADKDSILKGFIIKPIGLTLGNQTCKERVYVAPINDDMLLGHDILHHLGILHDMASDTLLLNGERIPVLTSFKESTPKVARVIIPRRTVIPPNSVLRVKCTLSSEMNADFYFQKNEELELLAPRVVRSKGQKPVICLLNPSEHYQTLKKGKIIGNVFECCVVEEDLGEKNGVYNPSVDSSQKNGVYNPSVDRSQKNGVYNPSVDRLQKNGVYNPSVDGLPENGVYNPKVN